MKMHLRSGSTLLLVLAAQAGLAQTNLKITAPTANVSGSENVTLGVGAGPKNTGSNNVFTGFRSGASKNQREFQFLLRTHGWATKHHRQPQYLRGRRGGFCQQRQQQYLRGR